MRLKLAAAAAAAVGVSVATMACDSSTRSTARSATAAVRVPGAFGRTFGTGCRQLPRIGGAGTRPGLPRLPVVSAMARVPLLSELNKAIRLAGLTGMLNTAPALTVFAPDNAAFRELGSSNLKALFATRSDLAPVVKFQIVAGRVRPAELFRRRVLTTIGGTKIYPARAAPSYYVNNGWITCGDLKTANATVYIVNQILIPGR